MILDPRTLSSNFPRLEEIEKSTLRLVTQAIYDFRREAVEIFRNERDWEGDIGEDITREALDRIGVSRIPIRLFGKIDYKRARYVFHPEYAIKQALFVDSKSEKTEGERTATIQTAQTSLKIRHLRKNVAQDVKGTLPKIILKDGEHYLTTTVFVKYSYKEISPGNELMSIIISALPNGMLQEVYNPTAHDTIWLAGRNAPSRGEPFRVRLSFRHLSEKSSWRVQRIFLSPAESFVWSS
ncbi:MAG TPA: SfiI family type II restriction endonuclease [Nitrospira sp.]|nr:SfiI family type II restriction endonuclease [Nitrospira sp.]